MGNVNRTVISGALAADPEVKWTSEDGESSIVRLGVIVRSTKKVDGEYVEAKSIFDVEVFGKFANLVARKLKKFDDVVVDGELKKDEWEAEGGKRSRIVIVARDIDSQGFFRSKDEDNAGQQAPAGQTSDQPAPSTAPGEGPTDDDIPF